MLKDFSKEAFDIVIQAGQSNSEGYGHGETAKPVNVSDRVWYFNQNYVITPAADRVIDNLIYGDYSLAFAREYIQNGHLADGRNLLILRCAVGGSCFAKGNWGMKDPLYLQMMDMLRAACALNEDNKVVALLWHQGEDDAAVDVEYTTHYTNLHTLISSVREYTGQPALPVIAADFVQRWKKLQMGTTDEISRAVRGVMTDLTRAGFVETDGLLANSEDATQPPNEDHVHFCRDALLTLGERYYAAFSDLIKGK